MRRRDKLIFLSLFFLSGACGLTYEIVWSRLLVFVFGGTTFAVTTVLTCFMGGLALGSWLAGRFTSQETAGGRPERLYGILEILIGLAALLVPVFLDLSMGLYRTLSSSFGDNFVLMTVARVLVSGIILLIPTTAMGATLPLLANAFNRHTSGAARVGGSVAVLYGANTFGAFAGCASAGFVLLPRLGLSGSTLAVAALNLLAGIIALAISVRPIDPPADTTAPETPKKQKSEKKGKKKNHSAPEIAALDRRRLLLLYAFSGFAAMAYQVAWTRALILSMGSSTYSFSTIVSCYIFGLAVGSLLMTRFVDRLRQPLHVAGLLQMVIALGALFVAPLFGEMPGAVARVTSGGAGFNDVLLLQTGWVFGLLIVPTLCMGALMPLICRVYDPNPEKVGRSIGDVYAANTAGTILGSAAAGFVLIPLHSVGMERTIHLASGLNLLVGTLFLLAPAAAGRNRRRVTAVAAWALAAVTLGATEPWSREVMTSGPYLGRTAADSGWEMVFYREGIDATVSVEELDGEYSMSVNGKPDASTLNDDMVTQVMSGMIPMLQRPGAREVCLIGLGSGVTAGTILAFDVELLDLAEISGAVIDASRFFDPVSQAPLDDPRLHMHRADGRNMLLLSERKYDVIVSEPSNPWISGIANLFTREFFELSRDHLRPGGIHAQWLQGYSMDPENFAAVLHTLEAVFGHVQVWEMSLNDYLMIASVEPFEIDVEELYFQMGRPDLQQILDRIRVTNPAQIARHWVGRTDAMDEWLDGALLLTDDLPHLEFSAPRSLLAVDQWRVSDKLLEFQGLPPVVDPENLLGARFLHAAEQAKIRGRKYRAAQKARERGDVQAALAALREAAEATGDDFRGVVGLLNELRSLDELTPPEVTRPLKLELLKTDYESWPFRRAAPRPAPQALADAGVKALDEEGDADLAVAHLLRAWLRAPDEQVRRDLARAYEARGDVERAQHLREGID